MEEALPDVTVGVVLGVPATEAVAAPEPATFTARTCTLYEVPLLRPVMVILVLVEAGLTAVKLVPPFVEYS